MSAQPNDGGPAFPVLQNNVFGGVTTAGGGMTLRDYFAAKAMQGYCANPDQQAAKASAAMIAEWAYTQADAMLAARGETP